MSYIFKIYHFKNENGQILSLPGHPQYSTLSAGTCNQLLGVLCSLKAPSKARSTSANLNAHTADPGMALVGVVNVA